MGPDAAANPPYAAPNAPDPFVDREGVLDRVLRALEGKRAGGSMCRVYLHGTAGIGCTGVACRFAAEFQELFPDGVLYLLGNNLSRSLGDVLEIALLQLGCPAGELPRSEQALLTAYRLLTAGKRLLVIVDDVDVANRLEALEPSSPHAMVIVTSRKSLALLNSRGYQAIYVPPLEADAARRLLAGMLADGIGQIDETTVSDLLRHCAGHPVAIRCVAGALTQDPGYAHRMLANLRARGVEALETEGDGLHGKLDMVYDVLSEDLGAAYRRLALNPGPEFGLPAAAVLLDRTPDQAENLVRALVALNLLHRTGSGRFSFHPLVYDHARRKAYQVDQPELRTRLVRALIEWYRYWAIAWEGTVTDRWRVIAPTYERIGSTADFGGPVTRQRALTWLKAEWENLEAAVSTAEEYRLDEAVRDLCFPLWTPFHLYGRHGGWQDTTRRGIEAARRLGDQPAVMQLSSQLGAAYLNAGDLQEAERYIALSLEMARQCRHALGQQSAVEWLGKVEAARGDLRAALRRYDESWRLAEELVDDRFQLARVRALLGLQRGRALIRLGEYHRAVEELGVALEFFRTRSGGDADRREIDNHAKVLLSHGAALLGDGAAAEALPVLERALALFTEDGSERRQAETLELLARAHRARQQQDDVGAIADETGRLRSARDIYLRLGDPRAADVSARLAELDG